MPLGEFFMSLGTIAFVANWFLEGNLRAKIKQGLSHKVVVGILVIFAIHLLGLLWTNNLDSGLHDIKIKLPFFFLPFCMASQSIFSRKQFKYILFTFVGATFISASVGVYTYVNLSNQNQLFDIRDISIFISHIRQSLMVVFSVVILFYYLKQKELKLTLVALLTLFFTAYLLLLQSLTGLTLLILFLVTLPLFLKGLNYKTIAFSSTTVLFFAIGFIWISIPSYKYYFTPKNQPVFEKTQLGNSYKHNLESKVLANGNYIWRNIQHDELNQAWDDRSELKISDNTTSVARQTKARVIRFLTSKGYTKDAEGVSKLTETDIKLIEEGKTDDRNLSGINKRIDDSFFEISSYLDDQNPSHNSISQRLYAWELFSEIFSENKVLGVGTGGTKLAYENAYNESKFVFTKRIRAHNQYLTFMLSFGVAGGIVCVLLLLFPLAELKNHLLYLVFYSILLVSFVAEDTLETQPGVLFAAFFIGLFFQEKLNLDPSSTTTT